MHAPVTVWDGLGKTEGLKAGETTEAGAQNKCRATAIRASSSKT